MMNRFKFITANLAVFLLLASGCGKTQQTNQPSTNALVVARAKNARSAANSRSAVEKLGQAFGENANVEPPASDADRTQALPIVVSPTTIDIPIQNLDSRLQDSIRNFATLSNKLERSQVSNT